MRRGLGFHNRRSPGVSFSPSVLFTGGVNGAWYDPSDSTTLFSDRAGTTPCGTPGGGSVVPVGLMLDKSQGLVLGSETVTNGDFSGGTTTGWTATSAALSVVGGQLSVVPSTAFGYAYQTLTTVVGTTYRLTFSFDQSTAAIARYFVGTSLGGGEIIGLTTVSGVGSVSRYFTATTTTTFIHFGAQNSSGLQALFDNISVRALAGNHAIAANDTTARPELRARVNLLTYSEQFDNAAWTKTGITAASAAGTSPDGTLTANVLTVAATTAVHNLYRQAWPITGTIGVSETSTLSFYAKQKEYGFVNVSFQTGDFGSSNVVVVNLSTGAVSSSGATIISASTTLANNGWWRVVITAFSNEQRYTLGNIYITPCPTNNTAFQPSFTGDGTSGIFIWGAQLTATNQFPANTYQRISDANTYDAVGFPRYLAFNGTSSAMSTPGNVNLSGTDKATVFAGVRKNDNTNPQVIAETSTIPATNNGSFYCATNANSAGGALNAAYAVQVRGTSNAGAGAAGTTAPISNVVAGVLNIAAAADAAILRVNGAQVATSGATSAGTGNFGTYPLFIGARNTSSLFLNGNIYSLLVVGSAVSAGQISATEQWVAQRTGIVL